MNFIERKVGPVLARHFNQIERQVIARRNCLGLFSVLGITHHERVADLG